ncbi:hypothetical protein IMCC3088_822 [Aequoribacter fuscus]|uniref:Uncharacterized protein n=1 Tax=Aequoribacter fuscus TaxID=2518989 RepID=F3L0A6_9GAMM|nr:hypothetical protein IMCC3088_822 [Aequoribacter fuscus]
MLQGFLARSQKILLHREFIAQRKTEIAGKQSQCRAQIGCCYYV